MDAPAYPEINDPLTTNNPPNAPKQNRNRVIHTAHWTLLSLIPWANLPNSASRAIERSENAIGRSLAHSASKGR